MAKKTVTIELVDQKVTGIVSNLDGQFFLTALTPEYDEVVKGKVLLSDALTKLFARIALPEEEFKAIAHDLDALREAIKDIEDVTVRREESDPLYEEWGNLVITRLNHNRDFGASFCQRVCKIFPDIYKHHCFFDTWYDEKGYKHEGYGFTFDVEDVMTLITRIVESTTTEMIEKAKTKEAPGKPKAIASTKSQKAKGFAPQSVAEQRAALQAQLAALDQE